MTTPDSITAQLMAPGAPFEVVVNGNIRVFKNAPKNMTEVFDRARSFGSAEFIVMGDERLTFDEFFERADRLSGWLVDEAGMTAGQSIAICMKNCAEWMIAFVGILNAGGVAVLVNSRGEPQSMAMAVSDGDCVSVIADGIRLKNLRAGGCALPAVTTGDVDDNSTAFDQATGDLTSMHSIKRGPNDLAAMFFTSGTTGRAKAAAISHRNLVTGTMNTQMSMAAIFIGLAKKYNVSVEQLKTQMPQACSLLVFPLFHTSGCSAIFLTALANGGKLVLMDRWNADTALELIEQEKITSFGGVPTMHWDLLRSDRFDQTDLSSLMAVSCGGQALPLGLLDQIRARLPQVFIGAGYGMTETSGAIAQANGEAFLRNPEASGQILAMMDVQISDDAGNEVPIGETGEIYVKGATLMQGYYGRAEDTARSMCGEWFKTGDIGRVDAHGYIYVSDRKTDMVISGGENIYCAEVEQALGKHPKILEIVTFGIPDDRLGERLVACAVVKDASCTATNIDDFAKENLASYKWPTVITVQTQPFAHNAMGKVEKHKVRDAYIASLKNQEQNYAIS